MIVVGLDEVGRGALAGDLVVAAAAFNVTEWENSCPITGDIKDSKKYSSEKVRQLAETAILLDNHFVGVGYGIITPETINELGMSRSLHKAFEIALYNLKISSKCEIDLLLVDGDIPVKNWTGNQLCKPKADNLWWPVSAASVLAKTYRDRQMHNLDKIYSDYGFSKNKGYGTAAHIQAIMTKGSTPIHRKQFVETAIRNKKCLNS